jgi:hypothetical protein
LETTFEGNLFGGVDERKVVSFHPVHKETGLGRFLCFWGGPNRVMKVKVSRDNDREVREGCGSKGVKSIAVLSVVHVNQEEV